MDDTFPSKFQYPKCKVYWAIYNNSRAKYLKNKEGCELPVSPSCCKLEYSSMCSEVSLSKRIGFRASTGFSKRWPFPFCPNVNEDTFLMV